MSNTDLLQDDPILGRQARFQDAIDLADIDQIPLDEFPLPSTSCLGESPPRDVENVFDDLFNDNASYKAPSLPIPTSPITPDLTNFEEQLRSRKTNRGNEDPCDRIDPEEFDTPIPERIAPTDPDFQLEEEEHLSRLLFLEDDATAVQNAPTWPIFESQEADLEHPPLPSIDSSLTRESREEKAAATRRQRRANRRAAARMEDEEVSQKGGRDSASVRIRNREAVRRCRQKAADRRMALTEEEHRLTVENEKMKRVLLYVERSADLDSVG